MTSRIPKTAALVAAATALAAGAYAIGSQSDGAAVAARDSSSTAAARWSWRGGPRPGLSDLATRIGVSESRLRSALDSLRSEAPGETAFTAALAAALGVDHSAVSDALRVIRSRRPAGPPRLDARRQALASALAKQLGVSTAKARAAFDRAVRARMRAYEADQAAALAKALGLDESKVMAAMRKVLPDPAVHDRRSIHPPAGGSDAIVRRLSKALGVSTTRLRSAMDKVRAEFDREAAQRRAAFAAKLADRLGVAADKIRGALEAELHGPRGFGGRGAPPGPFAHHA
jgi:hypothetical protein